MDEYIRREDALAVIRKYYPRSYAGTFVYRDIADLPAVYVAETGEVEGWIYDDYGYARCSCCGWEWDIPETVTPYCPNCGVLMTDKAAQMVIEIEEFPNAATKRRFG